MSTSIFSCTPVQSTDAEFRAWGSALSTALQAMSGLTKTSDTGQINWTTVAKPAGASTFQGYEVYRFNDALQATCPVYLKVEYGAGNAAANPNIRLTVSTFTDGAGTLTTTAGGSWTGSFTGFTGYTVLAGIPVNSYVSSGDGYLALAFLPGGDTNGVSSMILLIERARDPGGALNGEGVFVVSLSTSGTSTRVAFIPFPDRHIGSVPSWGSTSTALAPEMGATSHADGLDVWLWPLISSYGKVRPFMLTAFAYYGSDITRGSTFTLNIYGTNHTYRAMGYEVNPLIDPNASSNRSLVFLWE